MDLTPAPAAQADTANAANPSSPIVRPDVPQRVQSQVKDWWVKSDNLVQRANALWEYREANKYLFPARFNVNDPRRNQTPFELRSGRDDRRVQTPYIYRAGLQTTAMAVPGDITFDIKPIEQVKAPASPQLPLVPAMAAAAGSPMQAPPTAAIVPPVGDNVDPNVQRFADTLRIGANCLLEEVDWRKKVKAWVQDSGYFPCAVLKFGFRRDYQSSMLCETPPNRDESDQIAALEGLVAQFAAKDFDEHAPQYQRMLDLTMALRDKAEIIRHWGLEVTLVSMDAFGISEDASDLVSIYDAPYMFHDSLITGHELLSRFKYKVLDGEETEGILPDELTQAVPWDQRSASTDPNSRNRVSRNRQLTTPRATPANVASAQSASVDPKKLKYLVREIWCKTDRTVYTVVRGINHYLKREIPKNTSERWYPFAVLAPNRVPMEVYGASDLELKKDIQKRIHRKRSDEEKARWLHLRRYVYNKALIDEKEMVKVQDIPPGQFRGINVPAGSKMEDVVMPIEQPFDPVSFDTSKDEKDADQMGALPTQALGTTGVANFSSEVSVAAQGASVAVQDRQMTIQGEIEGFITCILEILLQELTPDEWRQLGGPFAFMPELYGEAEAAQAVAEAKARAAQLVAPQVVSQIVQERQMAAATGQPPAPIDQQTIKFQVENLSAPIWQQELLQRFGAVEPMTRESLYRRLKVKVRSSLLSRLDQGSRVQSLATLAQSTIQLTQAAQMAGIPFNPRAFLRTAVKLAGEEQSMDEIFPAVSPVLPAAQSAIQGAQAAGPMPAPPGGGGAPDQQGGAPQTQSDAGKSQNATGPVGVG